MEIRHLGGVVSRVETSSAPYGNRDAQLLLQMVGVAPTPEANAAVSGYIGDVRRQFAPATTGGAYLNFLEGDEKRARTRDSFTPESWRRLCAVKAAVDPDYLFSLGLPLRSWGLVPGPPDRRLQQASRLLLDSGGAGYDHLAIRRDEDRDAYGTATADHLCPWVRRRHLGDQRSGGRSFLRLQ